VGLIFLIPSVVLDAVNVGHTGRFFSPTFRENALCILLCNVGFFEFETDTFTPELLFGNQSVFLSYKIIYS